MDKKTFSGFPIRARYTPLPNVFFSALLPQIDDLKELKLILHAFWMLYQKKGQMRFVTFSDLLADKTLMQSIGKDSEPQEALQRALESAVDHKILVNLSFGQQRVYFLNNEANREIIEQLRSGDISLGGLGVVWGEPCIQEERTNIFHLYESNIGLVTPMLAEELADAEKTYPDEWIEQAFKEAVSLNKRSWRYVKRILERWATEGKGAGESGGPSAKQTGPEKYSKGKYGHLVRR